MKPELRPWVDDGAVTGPIGSRATASGGEPAMITVEPFFPPPGDRACDPCVVAITRGLARIYEPLLEPEVPEHLARLARLLDEPASPAADPGA